MGPSKSDPPPLLATYSNHRFTFLDVITSVHTQREMRPITALSRYRVVALLRYRHIALSRCSVIALSRHSVIAIPTAKHNQLTLLILLISKIATSGVTASTRYRLVALWRYRDIGLSRDSVIALFPVSVIASTRYRDNNSIFSIYRYCFVGALIW